MLEAVADTLRRRRTEGWLVGGTVRDRERGCRSPDLDVVVADDPAGVAQEIAGRLACPWFALSARHGAYRVMGGQGHVDVAGLRGAGILDDLAQRDFTINAMAVPVGIDGLIDPFDGRTHLREKRLVSVSDRIFDDDPLRLMRAVRFCRSLDMHLDPPLAELLRSRASALVRVAPERVTSEMALTLGRSPSAVAVRLWAELGLLEVMLPEIAPLVGSTASMMLERLDQALTHPEVWFPESAPVVSERLATPIDGVWTRAAALRLVAVTHRLSPEKAVAAGRRLRFSAEMISLMRVVAGCFSEGRCGYEALRLAVLAPRSQVLFLWDASPWEPESILLAACAGESPALDPARKLMARWADRSVRPMPGMPVDGEMLMREFGLVPGPRLGEILRQVRLAWEAGEVTTVAEAMRAAEALVGRP